MRWRGLAAILGALIVLGVVGAVRLAAAPAGPRTVALGAAAIAVAVDPQTGYAFVVTHDGPTGAAFGPGRQPPGTFSLSGPPNGAFASDGQVSIVDTQHATLLRSVAAGPDPRAVAVDAQSGDVLVADDDNAGVSILAAHTGAALGSIDVGARPHGLVVDGPTGRAFVVNTGDDTLSVVDTQRRITLRTMPLHEPLAPQDMSVDTRHDRAFVAEAGRVLVLDAHTGRVRARLPVDGPVNGLAVDSQSGHLYVTVGQELDELDPRTGRRLRTITVGVNPGAVVVDAQRGRVYVANTGGVDDTGSPLGPGSVSVVDVRRGTVVQTVAVGVDPQAMAVDERSGRVVVVNAGGVVPRTDPWAPIPGWLRRWLPFVPSPGSATRSEDGSVSILDRLP